MSRSITLLCKETIFTVIYNSSVIYKCDFHILYCLHKYSKILTYLCIMVYLHCFLFKFSYLFCFFCLLSHNLFLLRCPLLSSSKENKKMITESKAICRFHRMSLAAWNNCSCWKVFTKDDIYSQEMIELGWFRYQEIQGFSC
jgi:hypothetical protein